MKRPREHGLRTACGKRRGREVCSIGLRKGRVDLLLSLGVVTAESRSGAPGTGGSPASPPVCAVAGVVTAGIGGVRLPNGVRIWGSCVLKLLFRFQLRAEACGPFVEIQVCFLRVRAGPRPQALREHSSPVQTGRQDSQLLLKDCTRQRRSRDADQVQGEGGLHVSSPHGLGASCGVFRT